MKVFSCNGDEKFTVQDVQTEDQVGKIKVRVTKVLPDLTDINIFTGNGSFNYPFIPGHNAVGICSDDVPEYNLKRGSKLILNPYYYDDKQIIRSKGVDSNGFLSEYVYVDPNQVIPFPDYENEYLITEKEAIFTNKVSVALSVFKKAELEVGSYVVIIGGNALCNIIAQLALYFQYVPIVIDSTGANAELLKRNNIFYIVNESRESVIDRINEITCGKMADLVVLPIQPNISPEYLFSITREGGSAVVLSENGTVKRIALDISAISKRQISVFGISNGYDQFTSAVNIIAQKSINVSNLIDKEVEIQDADITLRELKGNVNRYYGVLINLENIKPKK